jgi:hypothetical protein
MLDLSRFISYFVGLFADSVKLKKINTLRFFSRSKRGRYHIPQKKLPVNFFFNFFLVFFVGHLKVD